MSTEPRQTTTVPAPESPSATSDGSTATERFTDKWRARWPEWRIGQVFLPNAQRGVATAWFALLHEFTDAAWTGQDATPGLAKLAWWNEELIGWAKGARRHPLAAVLQRLPVDWRALAASLRGLQATRGAVPGSDPTTSGLDGFAAAVAAAEARLFAGEAAALVDHPEASLQVDSAARAVVHDLLAERALLLLDADLAMRLRDGARVPAHQRCRPRRLQSAYLAHRLQQLAHGEAIDAASPWRSLLVSWRAARGA